MGFRSAGPEPGTSHERGRRGPAAPPGMDPRLRQRRIEVRRAEGRRRLRRLLIGARRARGAGALLWALTYSSVARRRSRRGHRCSNRPQSRRRAAGGGDRTSERRWSTSTRACRVDARRGAAVGRVGAVHRSLPGHRARSTWSSVAPWSRRPRRRERGASSTSKGTRSPTSPRRRSACSRCSVRCRRPRSAPRWGSTNARRSTRRRCCPRSCGARAARSRGPMTARSSCGSRPRASSDSASPSTSPRSTSSALAVLDELGPAATIGVLDVRAPRAPVLAPA